MQTPFAIAEAQQYKWPPGQIYAEAERNANSFAIAEAQQYKWPPGQIYAEAERNADIHKHKTADDPFGRHFHDLRFRDLPPLLRNSGGAG